MTRRTATGPLKGLRVDGRGAMMTRAAGLGRTARTARLVTAAPALAASIPASKTLPTAATARRCHGRRSGRVLVTGPPITLMTA